MSSTKKHRAKCSPEWDFLEEGDTGLGDSHRSASWLKRNKFLLRLTATFIILLAVYLLIDFFYLRLLMTRRKTSWYIVKPFWQRSGVAPSMVGPEPGVLEGLEGSTEPTEQPIGAADSE